MVCPYQIVTVITDPSPDWLTYLLDVFLVSIRKNAINASSVRVIHIPVGVPQEGEDISFLPNTLKLEAWNKIAQNSEQPILFVDADMLFLRDMGDVFKNAEWDVAITVRPGRIPINGGAVYFTPTFRAKRFFSLWNEENKRLYAGSIESKRCIMSGINQTALINLLERRPTPGGARVGRIPCSEFNCMDATWHEFDLVNTRLLHIKGHLRKCALGKQDPMQFVRLPLSVWKKYERLTREVAV